MGIATIFLGKFAPFDISDVCGMNLWDIKAGNWNEKLLELAAGPSGVEALKQKLGHVLKTAASIWAIFRSISSVATASAKTARSSHRQETIHPLPSLSPFVPTMQ